MNQENFDIWNTQKKNIHAKEKVPYFHDREIWYSSFGINVWVEQNGKGEYFLRPLVVIKKLNRHSFYALPLTSVDKSRSIHHVEIDWFESEKRSFASLAQLKIVSSKRLIEKKGMVTKEDYKRLLEKIKELFS